MKQTRTICKWIALFLSIFLQGCQGHVALPQALQSSIAQQFDGQTLWLKQSLYGGNFYDDDRYRLAHPRRFEELTYLKTPDGDLILPPPSNEIITVGTRVKILKVEWPTGMTVFKRPLFTPRHCAWVYLEVARDRGQVTLTRNKTYILLVPEGVQDDKAFKGWIDTLLAKEDTNPWLLALSPSDREGVLKKAAHIGMSSQALNAAMGQPDQLRREAYRRDERNFTKQLAFYGPIIVVLEDDKVVRIENSKK